MDERQKTELKSALEGKVIIDAYRGPYIISLRLSDETVIEFSTSQRGPNGEESEILWRKVTL